MTLASSRILVTGGSGFIGTNLVGHLKSLGANVLSFDRKLSPDKNLTSLHIQGDILDLVALRKAVCEFQPDFLVHLAARCDLKGTTVDEYPENTTGVLNVIHVANETASIRRIVFASSRYVHANELQPRREDEYSPFTAYGASKVEGEKIVRSTSIKAPWLIIRPTSIWGPWFDVPYKSFFQAVRKGMYIHPRGEKIFKSFGYVGNAVYQIQKLLEADEKAVRGRVFYTADYEPVEVGDMAERVRERFGAPRVRHVPLFLLRKIAQTGDLLSTLGMHDPPLTSFRLGNLRAPMVYDLSQTARIAGTLPFDLDDGIVQTVDWMKRQN